MSAFAVVLALALIVALAAPHHLRQSALPSASAIALWSSVLVLRAALSVALALVAVFYLPATELFGLLTHWCLHTVLPFAATHFGFDGHQVGAVAVLVPAIVIACFALSGGFAIGRGVALARRWLRRGALGPGPRGSTIVGGSEVIVAAAGLRSPRVLVSAGALLTLDDDELAAGLEHEWGHIRRRHGLISAAGQICLAVSRFLPGGCRALDLLRFHLERDADEYAVSRTGDPLALASAISKATRPGAGEAAPALAMLGGGSGVAERLRLLLAAPAGGRSPRVVIARALTLGSAVLALALALSIPLLLSAPLAAHDVGAHGCPA